MWTIKLNSIMTECILGMNDVSTYYNYKGMDEELFDKVVQDNKF